MENYHSLIDKFWEYNVKNPMGATIIAFYLFLLKMYNEKGNNFVLKNAQIINQICIKKPTIINIKETLRNLGLIHYQTSKGGRNCSGTYYKIIFDYSFISDEKPKKEKQKLQKSVSLLIDEQEQDNELQEVFSKKIPTEKVEKQPTAAELFLPKTENLKVENIIPNENILPHRNGNKMKMPSLEEFMDFAKTLEIYRSEFDFEIKSKYETWQANGWIWMSIWYTASSEWDPPLQIVDDETFEPL